MLNTFWILFELLQLRWLGHEISVLPTWKRRTIWAVAACLVIYGYASDSQDRHATKATSDQLNSLNDKVLNLQNGNSKLQNENLALNTQVIDISGQLEMFLKPGLKKSATELAATLIGRSTETLTVVGHASVMNPNSWPKEAQASSAQLVVEYQQYYANQVEELRSKFILQGQDWKDNPLYLHPSNALDIQMIGHDVLAHANALK